MVGASLLVVGVTLSAMWVQPPGASAHSRSCGHKRISTAIGHERLYFRVQGPVGCGEAKKTIKSYFSRGPDECIGSGCFIHLPSGWSCSTASGDVTQSTGRVTTCSSAHGQKKIFTSLHKRRGFPYDLAVRATACGSLGSFGFVEYVHRVTCKRAQRVARKAVSLGYLSLDHDCGPARRYRIGSWHVLGPLKYGLKYRFTHAGGRRFITNKPTECRIPASENARAAMSFR